MKKHICFAVLFICAAVFTLAGAGDVFAHGVVYDQKLVGENTLRVTLRWSDPGRKETILITSMVPRSWKDIDIGYEVSNGGSDGNNGSNTRDINLNMFLRPVCIRLFDVNNYEKPIFKDIGGHYAESSIHHLHDAGIVNGKSDELFKPKDTVTRAEFMAMLVRAVKFADPGRLSKDGAARDDFKDISRHWARDYILAALGGGLVSGFDDGHGGKAFRPDNPVTVAEACTFISRAFNPRESRNGLYEKLKQDKWYSGTVKRIFDAEILNTKDEIYWNFNEEAPINRADCCVMLSRALSK